MSILNTEAIKRYRDNKKGHSKHIFHENGVLYSYGYHFPLVVRLLDNTYIVNGDKRSATTSQHQSSCFSFGPQIPFSALEQAMNYADGVIFSGRFNYSIDNIKKVKTLDRKNSTYKWICNCPNEKHEYKEDGCTGFYNHTLGATLIVYNNKHILSIIDPTQKDSAYSMIILKGKPNTVDEALIDLMPTEVKKETKHMPNPKEIEIKYEVKSNTHCYSCRNKLHEHKHYIRIKKRGVYDNGVLRQGDLWFVPDNFKPIKELIQKNIPLPARTESHIASKFVNTLTGVYASGMVKHNRKEHYVLHLGDKWYKVLNNTAEISFSASGKVD